VPEENKRLHTRLAELRVSCGEMPMSPLRSSLRAGASSAFLLLLLAPLGSTSAIAATACYTENCDTCDNANTWPHLTNLVVATDFGSDPASTPIAFVDPADGSRLRLLATQEGKIWVWDGATGDLRPTPFLDLTSRVLDGGERGLLSLAVDPDYATSGKLYVYFTGLGSAPGSDGDIVVERYSRDPGDPALGLPNSAETILVVPHTERSNHNGGALAFGPDGMLYVSIGDGGGGCDDDISNSPNGQNLDSLLGKLLRLDVRGVDAESLDAECGGGGELGRVPSLNPLSGATAGCGEIWAYGLRNPFRFSVDRANGDIWIGDVGQDNWEEVNYLPASYFPLGPTDLRNFGWRCREGCGPSSASPSSCSLDLGECTGHTGTSCSFPTASGLFDPVLCHSNPSGWGSVIGGFRYRGSRVGAIAASYLYGDAYCGQIWRTTAFDPGNPGAATAECWDNGNGGLYGFAEDHLGELYLVFGDGRVTCIHDGEPGGCYWASWGGMFEDDFEGGNTDRWSATEPPPAP
jgi:glucose/arabinose dehydrogenase